MPVRARHALAFALLLSGLASPWRALLAQESETATETEAATNFEPGFAQFWQVFREAVTLDDRETVRAMTRFPIRLEGKDYDDRGFLDRFNWLFTSAEKECFASEAPAPNGEAYELRCGQMIFTFRVEGDGYRFTNIGGND